MEKKLRLRFVSWSISIVFVVLVIILVGVNVINYIQVANQLPHLAPHMVRVEDISNFRDHPPEYWMCYRFFVSSMQVGAIAFVALSVFIYLFSPKIIAVVVDGYERQQQFITGVTHELKTPLAIIKGNAEVIGMQDGHTAWTKGIIEQTNRLNGLVEYLISLAKLEEDLGMPKAEFCISDVFMDSCIFFEGVAKTKDREISYEIQPNLMFCGDVQNIELLISILLENAMKYSNEHSIIYVCLRNIKGKINISITNHAQNLEVRQYPEWFDRFYRADDSRHSSGFGIGLSMARAIVSSHKGKITAESLDGKTVVIKAIL
ncbi:MAG: hypothetical protein ATN35_07080 [Epulopiscium sp. Nele67-Bin004]|nr:MAG: hypothetical protein ATN35_07080 [Epulopiscium sp. Nele67-Bin004]